MLQAKKDSGASAAELGFTIRSYQGLKIGAAGQKMAQAGVTRLYVTKGLQT